MYFTDDKFFITVNFKDKKYNFWSMQYLAPTRSAPFSICPLIESVKDAFDLGQQAAIGA